MRIDEETAQKLIKMYPELTIIADTEKKVVKVKEADIVKVEEVEKKDIPADATVVDEVVIEEGEEKPKAKAKPGPKAKKNVA
ncbi:hypothetical protein AAIR98_000052 [Elusimicrobium simillimum]